MSELERVPVLSDEVANLAWEAAQASNFTFDELAEISTKIHDLDELAGRAANTNWAVLSLSGEDEARNTIGQVRVNTQARFEQLQDIAGIAMHQAVHGNSQSSPWSKAQTVEAVTDVKIPDVDFETSNLNKLEMMSPEFRLQVTTRYAEAYRATEGYIREGKLPESYRMPELKGLMDRIEAVSPAFDTLKDKAWSPSVEFVPEGLTSTEWNDLFAGHKLPNGEQMVGNYRTIPEGTIDTIGRDKEDQSRWDVAVISTSDRPIYTQVSKDGKHGSNAKEAIEVFKALPWVTATSKKPEDVIAQVSPREAVYNRMQLARLERGEAPVDSKTWTISQENVKVDGQVRSVIQGFYPDDRRVGSFWGSLDYPYGSDGVRPSASGSDLVFKAVTSS